MSKSLFVRNSITIQASASTVWDALVNPDQTKKYMFGCATESDWKVGSTLLWTGEQEGKSRVFVKGHILDIQPKKRLVYTTIDPNSTIDDTSENYLTVTYELLAEKGTTVLHVSQGDYATVAEGERRYQEASNGGEGWNPILVEIKRVVEGNSIPDKFNGSSSI